MQHSNADTYQAPTKTLLHKKGHNKRYKSEANITDYIWCPSCKVYLQNRDAMQEHEKRMHHTVKQVFQKVQKHNNEAMQESEKGMQDTVNQDFQEAWRTENLTVAKQKPRRRSEYRMRGPRSVHLEYNLENLWRKIYEAEGTKQANFLFSAPNVFVCRPCQVSMHVTEILDHVQGLGHHEAFNMEININKNLKIVREEEQLWARVHHAYRTHQTYIRIQDERHMFCFLCEKYVPAMNTHNLTAHINGKSHMKHVMFYLQSLYSVLKEICLNPHVKNLLLLSNSEYKESKTFQMIIEPSDDRDLSKLHSLLNGINAEDENNTLSHIKCTCLLCDLEFDSGALWLNHMNERYHEQNIVNISKTGKKIGKYICYICNVIMCGDVADHPCVDCDDGIFVPRVFVSGYTKGTNIECLYDVLQTYGTVTNCALTETEAIFEFEEREAIYEILSSTIDFQGRVLNFLPLKFKEIQDLPTPVRINQCLEQIFSSIESFDSKVKSICEIIDFTSTQSSDDQLDKFIERELSKAFNTKVKAYLFGSRVSGIAFPDSDMDVFADTGNMYDGKHGQEVSVQDNIVAVTTEVLKSHPDCEQVVPVPKARTPIVKFKYKPTNSYCDIAFRHGLGCENTKLIRFYLSLDPAIKPLIGFLKFWMQVHGLSGPRRFTSYTIVWLVIFFLQQLPDINFPTVEALQRDVPENIIAGWNCSFNTNRSALTLRRIPHSVLELVSEFFKFYNEFNFLTSVICPLTGSPEPKTVFKNSPENLPESMSKYVKRLCPCQCEKLSLTLCCVQDPFELSHNITKAVSSNTVKMFQSLCSLSGQLCTRLAPKENECES